MRILRHIGLDVHAPSMSVAVAGEDGVRSVGRYPHDVARLKKELAKLGRPQDLRIVYEAGPTGFGLYRALRDWGASCAVIAPSLLPNVSGDRVKTDRRDAEKLALYSFSGLLTPVRVPDEQQEALRDLTRAREAAKKDETRARHQLTKFLLRRSITAPAGIAKWSKGYLPWLRTLRLEERGAQYALEEYLAEVVHQSERVKRIEIQLREVSEHLPEQLKRLIQALQGFKGIKFITAVTIASELGDLKRFRRPMELMSYTGVVPGEHSSGERVKRGAITKCGNAHVRRVIGESAWSYSRGIATPGTSILKRREGLSPQIKGILEKADHRLRRRYRVLSEKGKHKNKVARAVGREMLGFIWAVGMQVERELGSIQD